MASDLPGILNVDLREKIKHSKVLVVGAGGIGCELLKNLVLTGFKNIEIIDLDTIDVSNLNRQFLFRKQHVGKSKVKVAKESAQRFNKNVHIVAHHDNITNSHYGVTYFKKFSLVMNALDNRAARNHVNRMCLAADIPLIESGSAGYLGQVCVIKKGITECYECQPKAAEKTFPGCTIRNTPSEFIHCVVWAKHLFNQLFGEADPDEDVSPDTSDPNAAGESGEIALKSDANEMGNIERVSTRSWAVSCGYDPNKLFHKLFHEDIKYLLLMDRLWIKRRPPTPLELNSLPDAVPSSSKSCENEIHEQHHWSIKECASVFFKSVQNLKEKLELLKEGEHLVWDKDDDVSMDFVAACSNIRAHIFAIAQKSRFEVKSMAGNIIPAIATSNAIIAGLIVMEALKVLEGRLSDCKAIYLSKQPHPKTKRLLALCSLVQPNPSCSVCSDKPEVSVRLNTKQLTVKMLEERILKGHLHMIAPDVEIEDGKGTILISSEEGETIENNPKVLDEFNITDGSRLKCDDFLQNYQLILNIVQCESLEDNNEFEVIGTIIMEPTHEDKMRLTNNGDHSKNALIDEDDDDDLCIVEDVEILPINKRNREEDGLETDQIVAKKLKLDQTNNLIDAS